MAGPITLRGNSESITVAIDELTRLLGGRSLQFDIDGVGNLRELFVDGVFDASKLVRVDCNPSALCATDVLVSFEPTELFLELLSTLRTRNRNGL